jgi:hypothetical protein
MDAINPIVKSALNGRLISDVSACPCPAMSPTTKLIAQLTTMYTIVKATKNHGRFLNVSHPNLTHEPTVKVFICHKGYHALH